MHPAKTEISLPSLVEVDVNSQFAFTSLSDACLLVTSGYIFLQYRSASDCLWPNPNLQKCKHQQPKLVWIHMQGGQL